MRISTSFRAFATVGVLGVLRMLLALVAPHGGQSPEERKTFLIVSGPGVKKGVVTPGPGIVAVTPTALKYLGVPIKPEWKLDGEPFGL